MTESYEIEKTSFVKMSRRGGKYNDPLIHQTGYRESKFNEAKLKAFETFGESDSRIVYELVIPIEAEPKEVVKEIHRDDNVSDNIQYYTPDGSGDASLLGLESHNTTAEDFLERDPDDVSRMNIGLENGGVEVEEYGIVMRKKSEDTYIMRVQGSQKEPILSAGKYLKDFHRDGPISDKGDEVVSDLFEELPEEYEFFRWKNNLDMTPSFPDDRLDLDFEVDEDGNISR